MNNNIGKTVYFHNWAGYDAILSLLPLLNLHEHGFTYNPIIQNGQLLSLSVFQKIKGKNTTVLTIKDSIKIIPGALGKLAQDFQVETLKDHFPHYFFLENIEDTLNYVGLLPAYEYFEPKRTSQVDYQKMLTDFKDNWGFLELSRNYILSDCKSLYQIIVKFFESFQEAFPINPLKPLTIPGLAFTTWRTVQLP